MPSPELIHAPNLVRLRWLVHGFSTRTGGFSTVYAPAEVPADTPADVPADAPQDGPQTADSQKRIANEHAHRGSDRVPRPISAWAGSPPQVAPQGPEKPSDLNLGFTDHDRPATVRRNREAFLTSLGATRPATLSATRGKPSQPWPLITLRQVHSDLIHTIDRKTAKQFAESATATRKSPRLVGDGLITNVPGIVLAVQAADCLPIILVDPKHHAIGVFHAGWRGTLKRIAAKGAGRMMAAYGTRFNDLRVVIGPGIGSCCYNVGEEVQEKFESQFPWAGQVIQEVEDEEGLHHKYPMLFLNQRAPGHAPMITKLMLNLAEANRLQLLDLGVNPSDIYVVPNCTSCNPSRFFSHRAAFGRTGRLMGAVALRP